MVNGIFYNSNPLSPDTGDTKDIVDIQFHNGYGILKFSESIDAVVASLWSLKASIIGQLLVDIKELEYEKDY